MAKKCIGKGKTQRWCTRGSCGLSSAVTAGEGNAAPEPRSWPGLRRAGSSAAPPTPSRSEELEPGVTINNALNGHFKLRASPRRVFTRLNCSLIMRGLGRSTWEV